MKQQDILNKIIPELRTDTSVTAVMLMGSVADGSVNPTSDIDLLILGSKNKFSSEIIDEIMVEYYYITQETAQSRLDKSSTEVYQYLGSKIIYDLDGKMIKLMRNALNKYKYYKVGEKEKEELRHFLYNIKTKLVAAISSQNALKADYLTVTSTWKIIEAIFAVNDIPLPTSDRVWKELANLKLIPDSDWFMNLFGKDTDKRTDTMIRMIDWVLLIL